MSLNSSNDSLPHANLSPITPVLLSYRLCYSSTPSSFILISCFITLIFLLLPLSILILYYGLQEWSQKRWTSSAVTVSHSDSFTYHVVTMELIAVLGCILCFCGILVEDFQLAVVGNLLHCYTLYGESLFHILTCVERYLAVIHPVTYLSLRTERGIRIRNISIGCVWLLSFTGAGLVNEDVFTTLPFWSLTSCLTVVSFCSISVLCALIRPGPGEQGRARERFDQSKLRAFNTILVLLLVLLLRFASSLALAVVLAGGSSACAAMAFNSWFSLPSSLVLPLLFLHKKRKLVCGQNIQ